MPNLCRVVHRAKSCIMLKPFACKMRKKAESGALYSPECSSVFYGNAWMVLLLNVGFQRAGSYDPLALHERRRTPDAGALMCHADAQPRRCRRRAALARWTCAQTGGAGAAGQSGCPAGRPRRTGRSPSLSWPYTPAAPIPPPQATPSHECPAHRSITLSDRRCCQTHLA